MQFHASRFLVKAFSSPWIKFRKYYDFWGVSEKSDQSFIMVVYEKILFYFLFVYILVFEVFRSNY